MTLLSTIFANFRNVLILILVLVGGFLLVSAYKGIKDLGAAKAVIEQQLSIIGTQRIQLDNLNKQIEIQNKFVEQRDRELEELYERLDDLTENLGEGADDLAPAAIREYFRRSK